MSYLQHIDRLTESNIGGIRYLEIIRAADVVSIGASVAGIVYGDIVLAPEKAFAKWYTTGKTAEIITQNSDTREGDFKTKRLPFVLPMDRAGIREQLKRAESDQFIVRFQDGNGNYKLFGTKEYPVKFEYDHGSSSQMDSRNRYDCQFVYTGPDNENFYNGTIAEPPLSGITPVPFIWNGVAIGSAVPGESISVTSEFEYTDFNIDLTIS